MKALQDKTVTTVICFGSTGAGKTHVSVAVGLQWLRKGGPKSRRKLVLVRPDAEAAWADESRADRLWRVNRPARECLEQIAFTDKPRKAQRAAVEKLVETQKLELMLVEELQGLTFTDVFVIIDEAQNTSLKSLERVVQRHGGSRCKLVINGDPAKQVHGRVHIVKVDVVSSEGTCSEGTCSE